MPWRALAGWFDPRGRLSRRDYGRLFVRLLLLTAAVFCLTVWFAGRNLRALAFASAAGALLLWLVGLAQTVRRLHDRGRSGWWLALYLALYGASFAPIEQAADDHPLAAGLFVLGFVAFFVWFLVETLGLRGAPGPNRYGPSPPEAG